VTVAAVPLYQCASIQQRFGAKLALDVSSLTLEARRIYTLAGANGSGKSTLLATLAFLARPASGRMWFEGEPVAWRPAALAPLRRRATLVHQFPYLFSGSIAHNLAVGLEQRGVRGDELRARVAEALARVDLAGWERRDVKGLSGGEAQRVAFARALLLDTRVLLLDEPLANVDRLSARVIEAIIGRLPGEGRTVVMSSHDPGQAERFGSEVIRLQDGRVAAAHRAEPRILEVQPQRPAPEWNAERPAAVAARGW
jgi:tungstate transport system ATP-binding protein